jgi:hypothetical protein
VSLHHDSNGGNLENMHFETHYIAKTEREAALRVDKILVIKENPVNIY